ncbi:MAG: glutamate synthase central domain-containing protein, partial [Candidatus Omnitrophota bacterium]
MEDVKMANFRIPKKQGLYDPRFEHDSCGVGFVCDVKGRKSNSIVRQGLEVLTRLSHRGAVGADPKTGDGAGILIQIPHSFFEKECAKNGISLPAPGAYGVGLVFLPVNQREQKFCMHVFQKIVTQERQIFFGWRDVPLNNSIIGKTAQATEPVIRQIFIGRSENIKADLDFERKLYVIRKQIENIIRKSEIEQKAFFYITNLSCRTLSYKGLLMPGQLKDYFTDLEDNAIESAICLVHSRYSTNTFPTWDLAQPFRFLAHNGEINTLRGNINWMRARESILESKLFGNDIEKIKPVIMPGGSDSATIDNVFELLVLSGRSLTHTIMMLIPAAWEKHKLMDEKLRDFYLYHACFMEPWDGPAAIAFTDGSSVGAVLDRNGLRPARYIITKQGLVVMASEVGVLDINPADIAVSGRLEPGKVFLIDTQKQEVIDDESLKKDISSRKDYSVWLKANLLNLEDLPETTEKGKTKVQENDLFKIMQAFGYSREDLKFLITPMAENAKEPIGSMGADTPHAVLSNKPQLLYNYFKQLFAQVTNPAIDPIREKLVMSLESYIGSQQNILDETALHCHKLRVREPLLSDAQLAKIRDIKSNRFRTKTISILFKLSEKYDFLNTIERICEEAEAAIE